MLGNFWYETQRSFGCGVPFSARGGLAGEGLIPRAPRRMKQPRKDLLREQLALAATTIEQQRAELERLRAPWWRRIWRKAA